MSSIEMVEAPSAGAPPQSHPISILNNPIRARATFNEEPTYICSVFPMEFRKTLNVGTFIGDLRDPNGNLVSKDGWSRRTEFILPAAEIGGYSVLRVDPVIHSLRDLQPDPTDISKAVDRQRIQPDTSRNVAQSLVDEWAHNLGLAGGASPGIDIIAGPTPTPEEIARLNLMQETFTRRLVTEADDYYMGGRRDRILDMHRRAAAWLRIEQDPQHPWAVQIRQGQYKQCIACRSRIDMQALVCSVCHRDLVDFAIDKMIAHAAIEATDPELAKRVKMVKMRNTALANQKARKGEIEEELSGGEE